MKFRQTIYKRVLITLFLLSTSVAISGVVRVDAPLVHPAYSFSGADGANPLAGLVRGSDGNLYGTTFGGGAFGRGTVFRLTPAASGARLTTLHSFDGGNGASPVARLVDDGRGSLYGTTAAGGFFNLGTVFRISISVAGDFRTIHHFAGHDGAHPEGELIQGPDGYLYGTTSQGGAVVPEPNEASYGTVFRIGPGGPLTTLHSFNGNDATYPAAGLTLGNDGNFYGTTSQVGRGFGTTGAVFRITPAGSLTVLHRFNFIDGARPLAPLHRGRDGIFYGTTSRGGAGSFGTVFRITPAGSFATLHNFGGSDGAYPFAGLADGLDGFYGTTLQGGANDFGTVYQITPTGNFSTLHSFTFADGAGPASSLTKERHADFYGTAHGGGPAGVGTIFKLNQQNPTLVRAIQNIIIAIDNMGLPSGVANSLGAPLDNIDPDNPTAACGKLNAFINQVNAKAANGDLTPSQASQLIAAANALAGNLGC